MLSLSELIAGKQHRNTLGKYQGGEKVTLLPRAQGVDLRVIGGPFVTAVPTLIVVSPVAILLAIGLVVLAVVTHEVAQGEAIMRGDEGDACPRRAAVVGEEISASTEPRRQFAHSSAISLPKAPDAIAVFAVPFAPQDREVTNLVAAWPDIPGLGN